MGYRGRKRKEEVCWKQSAIIRQLGPTQNDKARAEAKEKEWKRWAIRKKNDKRKISNGLAGMEQEIR